MAMNLSRMSIEKDELEKGPTWERQRWGGPRSLNASSMRSAERGNRSTEGGIGRQIRSPTKRQITGSTGEEEKSFNGTSRYSVAPGAHGFNDAKSRIYESPDKSYYHYCMSESIRIQLLRRVLLSQRGNDPEDPLVQGLPAFFHRYYSPYPLEDLGKYSLSKVFFVPSFYYKASDGVQLYAIRKLDIADIPDYQKTNVDAWKTIRHPNIVILREVFASNAFNNAPALFFAYDYYPDSETLEDRFCLGHHRHSHSARGAHLPDEQLLWAILIQLLSALYTIHEMGLLAQRLFHPSKIIIYGSSRVRISSTGIADLFDRPQPGGHIPSRQAADIPYLGHLMLKLATNLSDATTQDLFLLSSYSSEFHYVLRRLLGYPRSGNHASFYPTFPTFDEVQRLISPRLFRHLNTVYDYCDVLERELQLELDNGRLFRLLVKLGFINERPEYDYNASWSETGNRYLLKLFRDYVFHQVDRSGFPVLNLSHVVDSLNKLDLGVQERVLLMTRDEKSMFLIKYSELKHYLNESFLELYRMQSRSLP